MNFEVQANPEANCPDEILRQQVAVAVGYVTFDGAERVGIIEVNEAIASEVEDFFSLAHELDFPFNEIARASEYGWDDNALMANNVTSGFNYRPVADTARLSLHALGLAFDVNPRQNPYIRYLEGKVDEHAIIAPDGAVWSPEQPGTLTGTDPLVEFAESNGLEWGGRWKPVGGVVDYQHIQSPRSSF